MGAGNLDRGMAMDNQYIHVSKSTAYAPVIKAFDFAGNEAFDCNVTGMGAFSEDMVMTVSEGGKKIDFNKTIKTSYQMPVGMLTATKN